MFDLVSPRLIFIAFIWGLFWFLLLRAYAHRRVSSRQARLIWLMFFFSCVAFSFWGEKGEAILDGVVRFDHAAVFTKYMALSVVVHLFYLLLRDIDPDHSWIPMTHGIWMSLSAGICGVIFANVSSMLTTEQFRYFFILARDGVVTFYIFMSFFPGIIAAYQSETVIMMRQKLIWVFLLCICYAITSLGSLLAFLSAISGWYDPSMFASLVQPFVVAGMVFFILMMMPYRWTFRLTYFRQFYIYHRLKQLERRIFQKIGKDLSQGVDYLVTKDSKRLELQIYRTTISILDHYPLLREYGTDTTLYDVLNGCKQEYSDYDLLVEKLSRV